MKIDAPYDIEIDTEEETITVKLFGTDDLDPKKVTIVFPGGEVYVVGTSLGHHWAHICLNNEHAGLGWNQEEPTGSVEGFRYDIRGRCGHVQDYVGILEHDAMYHFAMEIKPL